MEKVDITKIQHDITMEEQLADPDLTIPLDMLIKRMQEKDIQALKGRTIWNINCTALSGGIPELLIRILYTIRAFDLKAEWVLIKAEHIPEWLHLTKKIHNFIHGQNPSDLPLEFTNEEKELFEAVNKEHADDFINNYLKKGDIVIIHDPQPTAMMLQIRKKFTKEEVPCVWRSHIGDDRETPETKAVWEFLKDYIKLFDLTIYSAKEYAPYYSPNPKVVYPSIHPLSWKNKYISIHDAVSILVKAGLTPADHRFITDEEKYYYQIKMLRPEDKEFVVPAEDPFLSKFGFLDRPLLFQISRWDHLKGWLELVEAFADIKMNPQKYIDYSALDAEEHERFIERMGLMIAGPNTLHTRDDPDESKIFSSIVNLICSYPSGVRDSIALILLPLEDRTKNALIVNALQRLATIVIQNSLREGFGLTLTEAMWKQKPCIASDACGLRQQLRPNIDGIMIHDPTKSENVAKAINKMIKVGEEHRELFAKNAKKRVIDHFLTYSQVTDYLNFISEIVFAHKN